MDLFPIRNQSQIEKVSVSRVQHKNRFEQQIGLAS